MKLRKFFGLTSRSVLEQVRAELGADAVIVANHATADGVEVTALAGDAIDTLLGQGRSPTAATAKSAPQAPPAPAMPQEPPPALAPTAHAAPVAAFAPVAAAPAAPSAVRRRIELVPLAPEPSLQDHEPLIPASSFAPAAEPAPAAKRLGADQADALAAVMAEVTAMRQLIEERFALMSFSEGLRKRPLAARMTRDLLAAGYSPALARSLTERLPDDLGSSQSRDWLAKVLARNLQCAGAEEEIVTRGGVYALIGPTGVGKTTTTAKLAARCAVRYGSHRVALITTDSFRIGAQDQLRIYGKILGLAVHTVSDRHDLRQALDAVRGRHLVLIDTVGMGQRDARVAEQAMLLAQPEIQRMLLLNACSQGETLDEVIEAYGRIPDTIDGKGTSALAGCIITKQDEASRHGAALDVAIRHRLRVQYVTAGQRVPEDIFVPDPALMVERSLRSGAKPSAFTLADEELPLAIHGGATLHA